MAEIETTPTEPEETLTPMEKFEKKIKDMVAEYGVETSDLVVSLAIEQFETVRNYPASWDESKKLADMEKNKSKIAMAAIEIDSKDGAENQLSHSENGTSRSYYEGIMAYKDVIGFANVLQKGGNPVISLPQG